MIGFSESRRLFLLQIGERFSVEKVRGLPKARLLKSNIYSPAKGLLLVTSIKILKIPPHLKGLCATRDTVCATIKVSIPVIYLPKFSHSCTMEIHSVWVGFHTYPQKIPSPKSTPTNPTKKRVRRKPWKPKGGGEDPPTHPNYPTHLLEKRLPEPFGQNKKPTFCPRNSYFSRTKPGPSQRGEASMIWSDFSTKGFLDQQLFWKDPKCSMYGIFTSFTINLW